MTPGAHLSAAIEVLADIAERRRPAADALKDWGLKRRFAGSKDRAAIASLVYDGLRRRASSAWLMGEETPRAILLGSLRRQRDWDVTVIAGLCDGSGHSPAPLSAPEIERLKAPDAMAGAPADVAGDYPAWLAASFARAFGDDAQAELAGLCGRAPVDIRVNSLKTSREAVANELAHLSPQPTPHSPDGLRFIIGEDGRGPSLQAEKAFYDGWFEIQDEGSQLAARLAGAKPGETVIDLCAGGGGKTLALAALMGNEGRIFAADADPRRLSPIYDRLTRAGATIVETRPTRGRGHDPLADLDGMADLVLVDAPCTGTGTWRRNPDAKWRLRPNALDLRRNEQAAVLARAARLVKRGGRIAYVTCSVLPEENDDAVAALLAREPGLASTQIALASAFESAARRTRGGGLQLSPLRSGTDGFYLHLLVRR